MAKLLKLRRGTTSQHSSFTGAEGEVTVDTTKDTAVVHDGSTAGGRPLLREDLNNMPASGVSAGTYGSSTALPVITVDAKGRVTSATTSAIDSTAITNGTSNVSVAQDGNITLVRGGTTQASVITDGIQFPDGRKAVFGNSNDLQIYHDGTNSIIDDAGTGNLILNGNEVRILSNDNSENAAKFITNGAVELYYDGIRKLYTKSDGVDISGELQCDTLDVDGAADFSSGNVNFQGSSGSATWNFASSLWLFGDGAKAGFGNSTDMTIYHDGGNSWVREQGNGALYVDTNGSAVLITQSGASEKMAAFYTNGAAELYYDNSKKFETVPGGGKVSGNLEITGDINLSGELNIMSGSDGHKYLDVRLGSTTFTIRGTSGGDGSHENLAKFTRNGAVELYYDNVRKFYTTSGGAQVTGTLTATTLEGDGIVPAGAIIMWSGAQNAIPSGYVICDGNNGTPNLYNRFIVAAGSSYAVGATGGSANTTLATGNLPSHSHSTPNHSHTVNNHTHSTPNHSHGVNGHSHSTPNHNHNMNAHSHSGNTSNTGGHSHNTYIPNATDGRNCTRVGINKNCDYGSGVNYGSSNTGNHSHSFGTGNAASNTNTSGGGNTGNAGANTTSSGGSNTGGSAPNTTSGGGSNTGSTGSGSSFDNRPPYYALCYIMKT